jgi:putative spermidine/putrescine transport system substrate-binding protein
MVTALILVLILSLLSACSSGGTSSQSGQTAPDDGSKCSAKAGDLEAMAAAALKEGGIVSYGMPDDWANWGESWKDFTAKYKITHSDTDMASADEVAKFLAEKDKPVADVGDIGIAFGKAAKDKGAVAAYKNKNWKEIPDAAKDKDGYWAGAYQGTIVFMVNTKKAPFVPKNFKDLLDPRLKGLVSTSDPMTAAQGQAAVMAASFANGGNETNIKPGIDFWKKLVAQGNYKQLDVLAANWQKGEVVIGVMWDFNALGYRAVTKMEKDLVVVVPQDATVSVPYAAIINKYAPHPCAARLWNEWLFSDAGQTYLAKGFARPIRPSVKLPDEVKKMLPADSEYKSAKTPKDWEVYAESGKQIKAQWEADVLPAIK